MNLPKDPIRPSVTNIKPYVPGKPVDEVERELNITGIIKLASNENPLGPSPKALEAINKAAKDSNIYPDQNCFELTRILADKLNLSPDNVFIGNGSDEVMLCAALAYISAGDEVVVSLNTFSTYETVSRLMEASIIKVNLKDFTYDLAAMQKMIGPKTKMVFICNPNNPTGTIVNQAQLDQFIDRLPPEVVVIIDEAYGEYVKSKEFPDTIKYVKEKKNVIITRTFSKIHGIAGLRVGYGIAKPEIIKYLNLVRLPFSVNRIGQLAAAASLSESEHVRASIKNNEDGKTYLYESLDKLGIKYLKTEANFIMINVDDDADGMFIKLMRSGVIIRPLQSFGLPGAIRVTVGTPDQNKKFIKALGEALRA
jgi:histidinol-phosphate aminotransferase